MQQTSPTYLAGNTGLAHIGLRIKEYQSLLALKAHIEPERGLVSTENGWEETDLRSTEIRFIKRDKYQWVYRLMQNYAREVQAKLGLDSVLEIRDNIQLGTYYPGDYYGWHVDGRTMSASVLLSDSFTGGRLEFKERGPKLGRAGDAVFFRNELHRVKPVLTGVRDSLVIWWK
jgi:hypothetical protein